MLSRIRARVGGSTARAAWGRLSLVLVGVVGCLQLAGAALGYSISISSLQDCNPTMIGNGTYWPCRCSGTFNIGHGAGTGDKVKWYSSAGVYLGQDPAFDWGVNGNSSNNSWNYGACGDGDYELQGSGSDTVTAYGYIVEQANPVASTTGTWTP